MGPEDHEINARRWVSTAGSKALRSAQEMFRVVAEKQQDPDLFLSGLESARSELLEALRQIDRSATYAEFWKRAQSTGVTTD